MERDKKGRFVKGHRPLGDVKKMIEHNEKYGYWAKGKKLSNEHRIKLSELHKGKKLSEETKEKMSKSHKNKIVSQQTREKLSRALKGKKRNLSIEIRNKLKENIKKANMMRTKETFEKIRLANIGRKHTKETKDKISKSHLGISTWNKGIIGEKAHTWKGGLSFEPYSIDWTKTLKKSIRERDKYICQICKNEGYDVHHIDYNKKNCNPDNLIILCKRCHGKTNANRNNWKEYFKRQIKNRWIEWKKN